MAYAAELCGKKLQRQLSSRMNEAAAITTTTTTNTTTPSSSSSKDPFASKYLKKLGWTEGTGLGKHRNGIQTYLHVQKRNEEIKLGIGQEKQEQELRNQIHHTMWWNTNIHDTLSQLQSKRNQKKEKETVKTKTKKKTKKEEEEEEKKQEKKVHYTDEELFHATGGVRFGMRAQRQAKGKWKRTELPSSILLSNQTPKDQEQLDRQSKLLQMEKEASQKMEWNGLGKAKVILSSLKTEEQPISTKTTTNITTTTTTTTTATRWMQEEETKMDTKNPNSIEEKEERKDKKKKKEKKRQGQIELEQHDTSKEETTCHKKKRKVSELQQEDEWNDESKKDMKNKKKKKKKGKEERKEQIKINSKESKKHKSS